MSYEKICEHFALLQVSIQNKGIVGFHDDKIACEDLFKGLLNVIYGFELVNVNSIKVNYPAIDLADKSRGICYQITFENTMKKIRETKDKYLKHEISSEYPELKIFIFGNKPSKRVKDSQVDYKDDVLQHISTLERDAQEKILSFLDNNCTYLQAERQAEEVKLMSKVINFLSIQNVINNDAYDKKPYPSQKLELRFKEFKGCIEEEYAELYAKYNQILIDAKNKYIEEGNSRKIKLYLSQCSREILFDSSGDGRKALDKMIEVLINKMNIKYFSTALRFYILSELIDCDIFPLSESEEKCIGGNYVNA